VKKALFLIASLILSGAVLAQVAPIRGQVSAGVYENLVSDGSGHLIINQNAAAGTSFTQSSNTVTTTSAIISAANTSRKFMFIQNNDATANVFVAFGNSATTSNGIKLTPGQSWQITTNAPTNAVQAISNTNTAAGAVMYVDGQ
jgi:hypothetical protein